jgi:hypothetical protein
MDHRRILSRAWTITWRYRALWLFGFLFALAGGGSFTGWRNLGSGGGRSSNGGGSAPFVNPFGGDGGRPFGNLPGNIDWNTVAIIILAVVALALALVVLMAIVRYVAETAMIAGVDEIESTETRFTVRRGFRLGWSRQAFRLFLTDLAIRVPLTIAAIVLLAAALSPLLLLLLKVKGLQLAAVLAVPLGLLVLLLIIGAVLVVSLITPYIYRRVVLGKQGVFASICQGWTLVRASLGETGLMWLVLAAFKLLWPLVMVPVVIVGVIVASVVGGVPAGLAYLISRSWVAAVVVGLPLFLIVFVPAVAYVQGLFELYQSTTWTLAYRETMARHGELLPVPAASA